MPNGGRHVEIVSLSGLILWCYIKGRLDPLLTAASPSLKRWILIGSHRLAAVKRFAARFAADFCRFTRSKSSHNSPLGEQKRTLSDFSFFNAKSPEQRCLNMAKPEPDARARKIHHIPAICRKHPWQRLCARRFRPDGCRSTYAESCTPGRKTALRRRWRRQ